MSEFKAGDYVIRIKDNSGDLPVGTVIKVEGVTVHRDLEFENYDGFYNVNNFKLHKYPNPPHKHCELIKAWADGAEIEYYNGKRWSEPNGTSPVFSVITEYRIKPQKSEKDIEIERIESEMRKLADDLAKVKSK